MESLALPPPFVFTLYSALFLSFSGVPSQVWDTRNTSVSHQHKSVFISAISSAIGSLENLDSDHI